MSLPRFAPLVVILLVGLGMGWFVRSYTNPVKPLPLPLPVRENSSDYKFINPLIFSKTSKALYANEFKNFNNTINSYITDTTNSHNADNVAVYFRDLNSGDWTGVNEDDTYEPASMLKVLVMVGTLKYALTAPTIMSKELEYAGPMDAGQYYKPSDNLSVGSHTVQDLINAMIIDSNNGAAASLLNDKDINDAFQSVYKTFLLPNVASATTTDYMSARSYSVVFRTLYDSTYLPWDLSDQALGLLADTGYSKGLVAGVPVGAVVAHKFGEYTKMAADGSPIDRELHDCGIIYYPEHPYLLCVMTRGADFGHLETVISDISKLVYDYVNLTVNTAGK